MPITQERLITLIETADKALKYAEGVKFNIGFEDILNVTLSAGNSAMEYEGESEDKIERLKIALDLAMKHLMLVYNTLLTSPLPRDLYQNLADEKAHFRATSKKNITAKNYAERKRTTANTSSNTGIDIERKTSIQNIRRKAARENNMTMAEYDEAEKRIEKGEDAKKVTEEIRARKEQHNEPITHTPPKSITSQFQFRDPNAPVRYIPTLDELNKVNDGEF